MSEYGFSVTLQASFDDVVERVATALEKEGFGILADIDVAAALRNKLGHEHRPYRILGACNPGYAEKAIDSEPDIGLLLPCNVLVRKAQDGRIVVSFMDPEAVLGIVGNPGLSRLGREVRERLERVRDALSA